MTEKNPVQVAVGKIAAASRKTVTRVDPEGNVTKVPVNVPEGALERARLDLQMARLDRAIRAEIEPSEPGYEPLPIAQRKALALLLLGPGYRVRKT